jgi:hypothetical protein
MAMLTDSKTAVVGQFDHLGASPLTGSVILSEGTHGFIVVP